jgi:SAM-dependent methyltransferase
LTDLTGRRHVIDNALPHLGGNMVGGDPRCWFPDLWAWLAIRFDVRRVLDVGCGEGQALGWWVSHGIDAAGLDGLWWNVDKAGRIGTAILHDLTRGPFTGYGVDLVWCCEVVEHIDEGYLPHLLGTLANGRVIALTHAEPGQDGHHHVNCQPADYWIDRMRTIGYRPLVQETNYGRSLCPHGYFGATGLIFERLS